MRKLNVRMMTLNSKKRKYEINHDFRIDYSRHIKNDNLNYLYIQNKDKNVKSDIKSYKYDKTDKNKNYKMLKEINPKIEELEKLHQTLYKKNYGRTMQKDKVNSFNSGVLTFPADMENDLSGEKFNQQEFIKMGIKTIQNMCKEFNLELIYITRHFDETTPHFHFVTSNFNVETGEIFKRNAENGKKLQDLTTYEFGKYGFERGTSKEITGLKSSQNEIDKLKNQIKNLTTDNKKLKKSNDELTTKNAELKTKNTELEDQNQKLLNEITTNKTEFEELKEKLKTIKDEYTKYNVDDLETKKETYRNLINPLIKDVNYIKDNIDYLIKSEKLNKLTPEFIAKKYVEITTNIKNVNEITQSILFKNLLEKLETPEEKLLRLEKEYIKLGNKIADAAEKFISLPSEIYIKYNTLSNEIKVLKGELPNYNITTNPTEEESTTLKLY